MPKKFFKKLFIFLLLLIQTFSLLFFIFVPNIAKADGSVPQWQNPFDKLQITIPGMKKFSEVADCPDDPSKKCVKWISEYIAGLYQYAIGIVGILAAVVLMVGGIIWLTAGGNQTRIGTAKSYIGASLTGLVIALSSYLILYQINPELIKLIPIKISSVKEMKSSLSESEQILYRADDTQTREFLKSYYITVNKGPCSYPEQKDCTSLADLPQNAVVGVINIKSGCNCSITITGGTETAGHQTHGPNKPILDLRLKPAGGNLNDDLLNYVHDKIGLGFGQKINYYDGTSSTVYNATDNSFSVIREKNSDGSEHFHVIFK